MVGDGEVVGSVGEMNGGNSDRSTVGDEEVVGRDVGGGVDPEEC